MIKVREGIAQARICLGLRAKAIEDPLPEGPHLLRLASSRFCIRLKILKI